jgi:hypothetical protein
MLCLYFMFPFASISVPICNDNTNKNIAMRVCACVCCTCKRCCFLCYLSAALHALQAAAAAAAATKTNKTPLLYGGILYTVLIKTEHCSVYY